MKSNGWFVQWSIDRILNQQRLLRKDISLPRHKKTDLSKNPNKPRPSQTKNRSSQERPLTKQSPSPGLLHHMEMWCVDHSDNTLKQSTSIDSLKIVTKLCKAVTRKIKQKEEADQRLIRCMQWGESKQHLLTSVTDTKDGFSSFRGTQ